MRWWEIPRTPRDVIALLLRELLLDDRMLNVLLVLMLTTSILGPRSTRCASFFRRI